MIIPVWQTRKLRHKIKQLLQGYSASKRWLENLNPGSLPQHPTLVIMCCDGQLLALAFCKRNVLLSQLYSIHLEPDINATMKTSLDLNGLLTEHFNFKWHKAGPFSNCLCLPHFLLINPFATQCGFSMNWMPLSLQSYPNSWIKTWTIFYLSRKSQTLENFKSLFKIDTYTKSWQNQHSWDEILITWKRYSGMGLNLVLAESSLSCGS